MSDAKPTVLVIDDDADLRDSIGRLLRSLDLDAQLYASVSGFLKSDPPDGPACLVLDVRLPGPSGLEFQRTLMNSGIQPPIIFISGHSDIPMSVQAMKSGAVEFLTKPLHEQALLDAIQAAIERDRAQREDTKVVAELRQRFVSLTSREREILTLVIAGRVNKQIAADLDLSENTVKVHRSQITRKMRAKSLVDLVRIADKIGVSGGQTS